MGEEILLNELIFLSSMRGTLVALRSAIRVSQSDHDLSCSPLMNVGGWAHARTVPVASIKTAPKPTLLKGL